MSLNYKQKYLKYKLKYLTTKKLYGGMFSTHENSVFFQNFMREKQHFKRIMNDPSNKIIEIGKLGAFETYKLKSDLSKTIKTKIEQNKIDVLKDNPVINNKTFNYEDLHGDIANLLVDIYYDVKKNGNEVKNVLEDCFKKDLGNIEIIGIEGLILITIDYLNCVLINFLYPTGDSPRSSVSPPSYN